MKVAFLTDYLGTLSGTEASICESAECMRDAGIAVAVVVFPREEPPHPHWLGTLAAAGATVFVLDPVDEMHAAETAWRHLERWGADVVHAIPMGRFMLSCLAARGRPDRPIVATETSEGGTRCSWYDATTFAAMASLDAVIAPCRVTADNLRSHFGFTGRIEIVPHLLRVPERLIRPLRRADLLRLPVLGAVTRLRVEKGIPFLLAALALATTPPACRLVIHGETFELDHTRVLLQALDLTARVEIRGPFRGRAEIDGVYAAHPILLLSSLFEGLPLALLNAIARGVVPIATDVGGVREILEDDAAGIVVPVADPTAMSLAIRDLVQDPDRMLRCSRAGVAIFRERFHASRTVARMIGVYRDLAG